MNSNTMNKIALGGGCHWCTEAVFQSLVGVERVEQGFVASDGLNTTFSEGVIVHFDPQIISLETLIEIHVFTHESTSQHSMRKKYRSAVYSFSHIQRKAARLALMKLQQMFEKRIITKVLPFKTFKPSEEQFIDYYYKDSQKPFCQNHIHPKLQLLLKKFKKCVDAERLNTSSIEIKKP